MDYRPTVLELIHTSYLDDAMGYLLNRHHYSICTLSFRRNYDAPWTYEVVRVEQLRGCERANGWIYPAGSTGMIWRRGRDMCNAVPRIREGVGEFE